MEFGEKDFEEVNAKVEKLQAQLDELIGSVFEHNNAFTEPYCIAEEIERVNRRWK